MSRLISFLALALVGCSWPIMIVAAEEPPLAVHGFNDRLNQALVGEGGVQVYQDADGHVGTVIDPPGGERRFHVQPPQSPSFNLGPPLQLHRMPGQGPPAATPPHTPALEFPQKAR